MSTVKILSGIITAAVVTSACSMAVFAQGQGTINIESGVNGEITYSFSGITTEDKENIVSADEVVTLVLGRSNGEGYHPNGSYTENGNLYLGTKDGYTKSDRAPYNDACGDYVEVKVTQNGEFVLSGYNFAYWKNDASGGYGKNEYIFDAEEGDTVYIGYRPNKDSCITSIKFTPDEFTPDKYSEAYTFNLNADEINDKSLVVDYTENDENKTTEPKLLSDLIETQISGEGDVLLTGLNFTDIPNTVEINSVTIE